MLQPWGRASSTLLCLIAAGAVCLAAEKLPASHEEFLVSHAAVGKSGGRLVTSQRAEAKTLNPVTAVDRPSRELLGRLHADLVHINRVTQKTEPALAKSWTVSRDGRVYTLQLRRGLQFSDGHPFDADDVVFSFQLYLDEKLHSPQRDLLIVGGQPIKVEKTGPYTVRFRLAEPYAPAERLFDGFAILPRHLLEKPYRESKVADLWSLNTPPGQMAGLGPFRVKSYVPGQRITLERNPHYWKVDAKGNRLPYLEELTYIFVPSEDAEALRFQSGETDVVNRLSAENYAQLSKDQHSRGYELRDAGPSLEFNFLLFNLNDDTSGRLPEVEGKQKWFRDVRFRRAVSLALDRAGLVRLVYRGHGVPLWAQVTPGNKLWMNEKIPRPAQSIENAKGLLRTAGFSWKADGSLLDAGGQPVEFTILASSSNSQRLQIANVIQQDLKRLGMAVSVVPLEFRAFVQRVTQSHDYDAAVMGIQSGDVDPNSDVNVWLSSGTTHLWNMGQKKPATPWEAEMDRLMREQQTTMRYPARKKLYDRVQEIVANELPIICVSSPNILVGSKKGLENFQPAVLENYTLHNVEELYWIPK
jgi:peptide/nickel transport system substrate-binding protein